MFVLGLIIGGTVGLVIYAACCVARRSDNQNNNNPKVVRCKDCKCCELRYPAKSIDEEPIEGYFCVLFNSYFNPTDFCSYGELKERDNE